MSGAAYEIRRRGGVELLRWPALAGSVDAAVTTRRGGVSVGSYESLNLGLHVGDDPAAVVENRRRTAHAFGARLSDLVLANQVHGAGVATVPAGWRGRGTLDAADAVPEVDALVTGEPGVVLTILVADCVPVVLVDPAAQVAGCVHVGWRGAAARVLDATLQAMVDAGADTSRVRAGIGPAIPAHAYPVGEDVAEVLRRSLPELADDVLAPLEPGRFTLDMWETARRSLLAAGVPADHVHLAAAPTGDGRFYSHRRQHPCGRFALLARLVP